VMNWQQSAVEELFGVSAHYDDVCSSFGFDVTRDGLRMLVTLFVLEDAVYVSIWREGLSYRLPFGFFAGLPHSSRPK
jgi:hypothetical protein